MEITKVEEETPLIKAVVEQEFDTVQQLVKEGSDVNQTGLFGFTALMESVREPQEKIVSFLVENGADVNIVTKETEETALTIASFSGHTKIVKYLISRGANTELGGSTALMDAAMDGHLDTVTYFLKYTHALINARTAAGKTALSFACEKESLEVVSALLEYGAEVDIEMTNGQTALFISSKMGNAEITRKLIQCNANVNHVNRNNETPLSFACTYGRANVVKILIEKGADVANVSVCGMTPLMHACQKGSLDVVKILLAANADVNWTPNSKKFNALSLACFHGRVELVIYLLSKTSADPYKKLYDNSNMLFETIKGGTTRRPNDPDMIKIANILLNYPNSIVQAENSKQAETAV